jgi:serpin B
VGKLVWSALPPDVGALVEGNNRFAFDMYHKLRASDAAAANHGNLIFSPYSISTAVGMVYAGARGQTAQEIADVFHFGLPQERLHPAYGSLIGELNGTHRTGYQLSVANRLWGQNGFPMQQPFLDTTRDHYRAELGRLDFVGDTENSRQSINRWVEDQTNERIKDLIPQGGLTPDTRLVLTNAIYFQADWRRSFRPEFTTERAFFASAAEQVHAPTMFQNGLFRYAETGDFQMLDLPYKDDQLSMLVLLPKAEGHTAGIDALTALEARLTPEVLESSIENLRVADVNVWLPKFKIETGVKLKDTLADMGMPMAFASAADFSGIAHDPLAISQVRHKAFIELDEAGTEAAAATSIEMVATSAFYSPDPPITFNADHPFHFLIRDNVTGSTLFMGRVARPEGEVVAIPEPASMVLCIVACACVVGFRRRFRMRRGN